MLKLSNLTLAGGSLGVRNPWVGTERATRGAIAVQSRLYKPIAVPLVNNKYDAFFKFNGYAFFVRSSSNSVSGTMSNLYRTSDLVNFSGATAVSAPYVYTTAAAVANGILYVASTDIANSVVYKSTDGVSFVNLATTSVGCRVSEANGIAYFLGQNASAGMTGFSYSLTGATIATTGSFPLAAQWCSVKGNGTNSWIAISADNRIAFSSNGVDFSLPTTFDALRSNYTNALLRDVVWAGNKWVAIMLARGSILTFESVNGSSWTLGTEYQPSDANIVLDISGVVGGNYITNYWHRSNFSAGTWYNGQYFFKAKLLRPERGQTAAGTSISPGGTVYERLVATSDFQNFVEHTPHIAMAIYSDIGNPVSLDGVQAGATVGDTSNQAYGIGGVFSTPEHPLFFAPTYVSNTSVSCTLIEADLINARELFYAM